MVENLGLLSFSHIKYIVFGILIFVSLIAFSYSFFIQGFRSIKEKHFALTLNTEIALLSLLQIFIVEGNDNDNFTVQTVFLTFLFHFFVFFIFFKFPKIFRNILTVLHSLFWFIYSLTQRYVIMFKGKPYYLSDVENAETAKSVASNYSYVPNGSMIFSFILFIIFLVILFTCDCKKNKKFADVFCIFGIIIFTALMIYLPKNNFLLGSLFDIRMYQETVMIKHNGYIGNLYVDFVTKDLKYPNDYDEEKLNEALDKAEDESKYSSDTKAVNVICILDESLYDFNLISSLKLNKDYLEFFHSKEEKDLNNTIKGYTVVSAYGGGTPNSEYEFLVGGNLMFFDQNSYPLAKYIVKPINSVASFYKENGFDTITFHPFTRENWHRDRAYPFLGFDTYLSKKEMIDYINEDGNTLRGVLSDEADFNYIKKLIEEKKDGEKLFIYNVTIANHSGYEENYGDTEITDSLYNSDYFNNYLNLAKRSDRAIKDLCEYVDNLDEPTILCVFGDHIPGSLENITEQTPDFMKASNEKLQFYRTPFIIHTNYDIEEDLVENMSLSYLANIVVSLSGYEKTDEQKLLTYFQNNYPIIHKYEYVDKNGEFVEKDNLSDDLKIWRDLTYKQLLE